MKVYRSGFDHTLQVIGEVGMLHCMCHQCCLLHIWTTQQHMWRATPLSSLPLSSLSMMTQSDFSFIALRLHVSVGWGRTINPPVYVQRRLPGLLKATYVIYLPTSVTRCVRQALLSPLTKSSPYKQDLIQLCRISCPFLNPPIKVDLIWQQSRIFLLGRHIVEVITSWSKSSLQLKN